MKYKWTICALSQTADNWYQNMRTKLKAVGYNNSWWSFIWYWQRYSVIWIKEFEAGIYQFSPMIQYKSADEVIRVWPYLDRLMIKLILIIIRPTFQHIIAPVCMHLTGPSVIKNVIAQIRNALNSGKFNYYLRIDIRSYYASINHSLLIEQLGQNFNDPRLLRYFKDIITIGVYYNGCVFLPKSGIPRCSALSPFFGALYLSALDTAFTSNPNIFYRRYMDDIIILVETKRQYTKARKRLFKILSELKLQISPHKTRMGALQHGFHFLGVDFEVSRNPQRQTQVAAVSIHARTCRRALDNVQAMSTDAVHPANIQRYLSRWAAWWYPVVRLERNVLIYKWLRYTERYQPALTWFGRGLLLCASSNFY